MNEISKAELLQTLRTEYGARVVRSGAWAEDELNQLLEATGDLARFLGGPARFRQALGRVFLWRVPFRTAMAAMAAPFLDVVYFQGASWGNPPEFKWQTVHELAHVWDMHLFGRLSRGLKAATGSRYGRFKWKSPFPFEYQAGGDWLPGRKPPPNALEDWADSVPSYVYREHAESRRPIPRLISPVRWEYVREHMYVRMSYPPQWIPHFYGPERVAQPQRDR
jgi:hypothetical protein